MLELNNIENSSDSTTGALTTAEIEQRAIATQNALLKITNQIRGSLEFSVICETVNQEMLSLLEADRVAIYRFNPDWSGCFVSEALRPGWIPLVEAQKHNDLISKNVSDCSVKLLNTHQTADTHLQATYGGTFVQGKVFRVCEDIENAGFSDCYVEVLQSYQARSYAIIAIYLNNQLWGLLAAYQNTGPRQWQEHEMQLLIQVAEQLGIALKQAEYVTTIQHQTAELNETLQRLKQSQAQLVQGEKMASLGQLVAGIAHEINNPVNFIQANLPYVENYVESLLTLVQSVPEATFATGDHVLSDSAQDVDLDFIRADLPKVLASMSSGSTRIQEIVRSLRNFSRLNESGVKRIDLHEGIDSTLVILNHQLVASGKQPKIDVVKDYGNLPLVECDPAQINQVILAILTNAIDSLKAACRAEKSSHEEFCRLPQLQITTQTSDQNQVVIRIQDNGLGIEEQHQSKVFDYFFTTKPVGEGTGLGLAIARQIVEDNHGGKLSLDSNLDQGAAFVIQLPVSQ